MPHAEFELATDHSVGMLLQTYLEADPDVTFVAYHALHPLERRIALRVATSSQSVGDALRRAVAAVRADLARV